MPDFTEDWFTKYVPNFQKFLSHMAGRKINYLEVGSHEGRSLLWISENILTHKLCKAVAIDIFNDKSYERKFNANTRKLKNLKKMKGRSCDELLKLPSRSFDLIYIDGSHTAYDVLVDAILCWRVARSGCIIMFDDYLWRVRDRDIPRQKNPKMGIDMFLELLDGNYEVLHMGYQLFIKKD